MTYDDLLIEAETERIIVKEKALNDNDGRIYGNRVAIRKNISSSVEKSCVLAEELGHYYTTSGDIVSQDETGNKKQEYKARLWGYNKKVGLQGLIQSFNHGCQSWEETAEFLDVTEEYLTEVINCYRSKYGVCTTVDNYIICFEPYYGIAKIDYN
ncbi:hypothetical protein [Muricomes intestini]|uniref:hypothetical protein n=1 Tax=Muricomes intestini TaxID=1796634 RepID=UPI003A5C844C